MSGTISSATPTLQRQVGMWSATALVVSNMIGTGIFTTTGFLAGDLGEPWLVLGIWVVGAAFALAGALCYSELGVNFPTSGGEYVYLTRAYGPVWGFLSGWVSFFAGFSAPIAAAALAFAGYLAFIVPWIGAESSALSWEVGGITWQLGATQALAAGLVLVLTLLNCVGIALVARVQNVLTAIKVVVIVAFVLLGVAVGEGSWGHLTTTAERTSTTPLLEQFAVSLFWVMFGYSGWNAATYVAEELRDPHRTLPRALIVGTVTVALLYLALNVVFIFGTQLETMKGVVAVGALAAAELFGPQVAGIFGALMALAIVSTVNAMITIGPRVYYAMAKDGAFLSVAARLHPRSRVPVVAVVCQGACAMLMTFTSFPQLVIYIGFSLTFFTVLAVSSLFVFRRRPGWRWLPAVSVAFPLVPASYLLVGSWMIYYGFMLRPAISAAAVLTLVAGAAVYYARLRAGSPGGDR
ncbi:MAG TPA: amino acid permease [Vicinamibacterales bacterium]|nr:amino acid permease [Vicinamibacterales bacterium]